jgi:hypothetical protein
MTPPSKGRGMAHWGNSALSRRMARVHFPLYSNKLEWVGREVLNRRTAPLLLTPFLPLEKGGSIAAWLPFTSRSIHAGMSEKEHPSAPKMGVRSIAAGLGKSRSIAAWLLHYNPHILNLV